MKKIFTITHPKIRPDRQIEAVKRDINKYIDSITVFTFISPDK